MKKVLIIVTALMAITLLFAGCAAGRRVVPNNPLVNTPANDRYNAPGNTFGNYNAGNNGNVDRKDNRYNYGNRNNGNGFYSSQNPLVRTPRINKPLVTPNVPNNYPNRRVPGSVNVRPGMDFVRAR